MKYCLFFVIGISLSANVFQRILISETLETEYYRRVATEFYWDDVMLHEAMLDVSRNGDREVVRQWVELRCSILEGVLGDDVSVNSD